MSDLAELKLQVSTLANHQQNMRELLQAALTEIARLKGELALTNQSLANHKTDVRNAVDEFAKLKNLVATIREETARNLTTLHQAILNFVDDKVKGIPNLVKKIENMSASLIKYDHDLEAISLDSRNSMLKTNNLEVLVNLNRKKLENIQLTQKQPKK